VWGQSGLSDFPLARLPNAVVPFGVIGQAVTQSPSNIYAVGFYKGTAGVWRNEGYDFVKVSTPEVDRYITDRFDLNVPFDRPFYLAYYQQEDHRFVVLNRLGGDPGTGQYPSFDTTGRCYVYDEATQTWHTRTSGFGSGVSGVGYPITWIVADQPTYKRQGKFALAAGPKSGGVVEFRSQLLTDTINTTAYSYKKAMTTQRLTGDDRNLFHHKLRIDSDQEADGSNITLYSQDHGLTRYNHGERSLFKRFVEWWRLGYGDDRTYRIESDANVRLRIVTAFLELSGGRHSGGKP